MGVSLNTAIQVYYELEKDGFIVSRPKSGYIVSYRPTRLSAPVTTQPAVKFEVEGVADLIAEVYSSLEMDTGYRLSNNSKALVRRFFLDRKIDALPLIPLNIKGLLVNKMVYVRNTPSGVFLVSVLI